MSRPIFIAASVVTLFAACAPSFQNHRTPSGDFCSDMPVLAAGQVPDREYHRLRPVSSDPEAHNEAERLESLRKAACYAGADGVIEASTEELRLASAGYTNISSGTAITWVRHGQSEPKPLRTYPTTASTKPSGSSSATPASAPPEPAASAEPATPPPADSGKAPAGADSSKTATPPPAGSGKAATPAGSSSAKVAPPPPKKKS
jgi:hypothetical protein